MFVFRCSDISVVDDVDIVGDDDDVDALVKKSEGMLKAKRDPGTKYGRFLVSGPKERYRNGPDRSEQRTGTNETAFGKSRWRTVHGRSRMNGPILENR